MITSRIIRVEGNSYTSHLTVNVSRDMIGQNITCAYDNGSDTREIGSITVNTESGTSRFTINA